MSDSQHTPLAIGLALSQCFSTQNLPKQAGLDILTLIIDRNAPISKPDNKELVAGLIDYVDGLVEVFAQDGASAEEVAAGAVWLQEQVPAVDTLLTSEGADDDTIH